jgi:hypothetical protein
LKNGEASTLTEAFELAGGTVRDGKRRTSHSGSAHWNDTERDVMLSTLKRKHAEAGGR